MDLLENSRRVLWSLPPDGGNKDSYRDQNRPQQGRADLRTIKQARMNHPVIGVHDFIAYPSFACTGW
jgi:hypothetical protein